MQPELTFKKHELTDSNIRFFLNPKNKVSPYYGFIGNEQAIRKLMRIDFAALQRTNHCCADVNLAFIGKAGCGKTALVRRHMFANSLPCIEIHPKSIKTVGDIFKEVHRVCLEKNIGLVEEGFKSYTVPPINLFIDEVHALPNNIVQSLLKATEANDRFVVTEENERYDCKNIHWIIATTDRGLLFDAFDTRFTKINLSLYTKDQIAQIIKMNYKDFPDEVCRLVAHYCGKVPREALAFAKEMKLERNMSGKSWEETAKTVARDNEIDDYGMSYKRFAVLKAIANRPMSRVNLATIVGIKVEELEKFILPWLMESTEDQPSCVLVTSRGVSLTEQGAKQLEMRGILHSYSFDAAEGEI